jgi:hypothetical protein
LQLAHGHHALTEPQRQQRAARQNEGERLVRDHLEFAEVDVAQVRAPRA